MPDSSPRPVDEIEDELFGVPLAEFVATRNERVRALRKAGRKDDATRLAALRRPAVAAWALNQVARRDPQFVQEALALGATMREAMEGAFGGDAAALRTLQPQERSMVAELARRAAGELTDAGAPPNASVVQHLTDTARAALADEALGEQLRAGRLTDEHAPAGFGFGAEPGVVATAPRRRRAPSRTSAGAAAPPETPAGTEDHEASRAARERAAAEQAAQEAEEARAREQAERRREAAARRREADRLARAADALEAAADAARRAADDAEESARLARRDADEAEAAAQDAEAALD